MTPSFRFARRPLAVALFMAVPAVAAAQSASQITPPTFRPASPSVGTELPAGLDVAPRGRSGIKPSTRANHRAKRARSPR